MNCTDCEARLIDHACLELPEDERVVVARHLAHCPSCALEYCRLQVDLAGIVEAHAEVPRPEVFEGLRRRVAAEVAPPWWARAFEVLRHPVPVYGVVLAGLVPAALWLMSPRHPDPASSPQPSIDSVTARPTLVHYDASEPPPAHRDVL
jgi:anti-sigma factor RsiW